MTDQKNSGGVRAQRINEYLESYWNRLRGERPYPTESEVTIEDLEPVWNSCFLVRCSAEQGGERPFTYLFMGQSLVEAYRGDGNQKEVCEKLVYPSNISLVHKFREVLEKGAPVEESSEFINSCNMQIRFRSTLLPLADETGEIGYILGGMKWREY